MQLGSRGSRGSVPLHRDILSGRNDDVQPPPRNNGSGREGGQRSCRWKGGPSANSSRNDKKSKTWKANAAHAVGAALGSSRRRNGKEKPEDRLADGSDMPRSGSRHRDGPGPTAASKLRAALLTEPGGHVILG